MPVNKLARLARIQREEVMALRRECERLAAKCLDLQKRNDELERELLKLRGTSPN